MDRYPETVQAAEAQHAAWKAGGGGAAGGMQSMMNMWWGSGAQQPPTKNKGPGHPQVKKQKVDPEESPKGYFNTLISIVRGQSLTKDDLKYDVTEAAGGFVCQMTM